MSSARSTLGAAFLRPFPHFQRRTFSSSRIRTFFLAGATALTFVACIALFRSWFTDPAPAYTAPAYATFTDYREAARVLHPSDREHARRSAEVVLDHQGYRFELHPRQELGALVGFLTALASNSIPDTVDPQRPIDPQLVLGFDTRTGSDEVVDEVESIVTDTWARNPVVIFSELHSTVAPASREVKTIIGGLRLYPQETIFEVDQRVDADVLRPLLTRLTGSASLPIVLIGGKPLGSLDAVRDAHTSDLLTDLISASGAIINGKKHKKGRKH